MKNSEVSALSFISYVRFMGPGIVVVLTWLGTAVIWWKQLQLAEIIAMH